MDALPVPIDHTDRIEVCDAKMWRRDVDRMACMACRRSKCSCRLCFFGRPVFFYHHKLCI